MVQIVKEPHGTKGARVSTQIYLPGHLLVFLPMVDFIGISKRITNEAERARLRGIIENAIRRARAQLSEPLPKGAAKRKLRQTSKCFPNNGRS